MQEDVVSQQQKSASLVEAEYVPLSEAHIANPYRMYRRIRQEEPVFYSPITHTWVVSRYEDVLSIFKDHQHFSIGVMQIGANIFTPEVTQLMSSRPFARAANIMDTDPPEHTRLRGPITRVMSAQRMTSLEPRIRQFADQLIDQFSSPMDFVEQFGRKFPILVMASLLNVPLEDVPQLRAWADDIVTLSFSQPPAEQQLALAQSFVAFERYTYDLVEQRRKAPQDDLASDLLQAVDAGQVPLSPLEAARMIFVLFGAGFETTIQFLGNCLFSLLSDRAYWQDIHEHPQHIPAIIEEALRFNAPSLCTFRVTTQDVELGGKTIPRGSVVQVLMAAADYDETVFAHPESFDPQREKLNRHLAFGYGVHFCIGAPLARLETRVALEQLSQRIPSLRLVPGQSPSYPPNLLMHGIQRLLIEWDGPVH